MSETPALTPREIEVAELVACGMDNYALAAALDISHQTVKNHMTAILRKLRLDHRTQLAVYALHNNLADLDTAYVVMMSRRRRAEPKAK